VRVSLHAGDRETWAALHKRGDPALFDTIERGVSRLAQGNPRLIEVLFVIMNANLDNLPQMMDFALRTGVRRVLFRPMRLFSDFKGGHMNAHLQMNKAQYEEARHIILEYKKRHTDLEIDLTPFLESAFDEGRGRPSSLDFFEKRACLLGWVMTVINVDGTLVGCLDESFDRPLGNVFESSLKEIWWSEAYAAFRARGLRIGKGDPSQEGCHTYCQHVAVNRKMNALLSLQFPAFFKRGKPFDL